MNHNGNAHTLDIPAYIIHAKDERGRTFRQIENDLMEIFNVRKDHVTVQRWYEKHSRKQDELQQPETAVQQFATPETVAETAQAQTAQNEILNAENTVSSVASRFMLLQFVREFAQSFHPADLVFYAVVAIGCAGVSGAFPGIGIAVASVWFAVSALYLHRVKMYARWFDIALLAIFEVCAGFVADWVWANNALWANISRLPFRVYVEKYENGAGELVAFYAGKDVEMPAYVACYIAAMLVIFGGAAVAVSTLAVQNSITIKK